MSIKLSTEMLEIFELEFDPNRIEFHWSKPEYLVLDDMGAFLRHLISFK
jgi:hypothetical protein